MKKILIIILLTFKVCYSQLIPHTDTLTVSKDSISYDETFTVTYTLTDVKGYVYIGVAPGPIKVIGNDRWEGNINYGEKKKLKFRVKIKENLKHGIEEYVNVSVGFSFKPFGNVATRGQFESVLVKVFNFQEYGKKYSDKVIKKEDHRYKSGDTIPISTPDSFKLPKKYKIKRDSNTKIKKNKSSSNHNETIILNKKSKKQNTHNQKSINRETNSDNKKSLSNEIRFGTSSMSFRNENNEQVPFKYFTVQIWGLETENDEDPVVLAEKVIGNSTSGGFAIQTNQNYNYYRLVILLEGDVYIALSPPDDWNGNEEVTASIWGIAYEVVANPGQDIQYNVEDPDYSYGALEISRVLNICNGVISGHNYTKNNTSDSPEENLVFYNKQNSTITNSFTGTFTDNLNNSYYGIYISYNHWRRRDIVIHEYGHVIQMLYGANSIPEDGGTHYLGIRYNPQLAFSEGWAHFFAAAVTSNAGIDPNFNLSANPPYSISYGHHFTPETKFEGNCDEVMNASLLWELYSESGNNYSYMHHSLKTILGTGHKPYNIFEFIKNHKLYYDPGNGTGYWVRAGENLKIGTCILR